MILSLSSLFFFRSSLSLATLSQRLQTKTFHNQNKNTKPNQKIWNTKKNLSHKPNEIWTIKAKNRILSTVGRRTSGYGGRANWLWRKTHLYCMNYTLITLLIIFLSLLWHTISMIVFLAIFVAWYSSLLFSSPSFFLLKSFLCLSLWVWDKDIFYSLTFGMWWRIGL